MFIAHNLFGSGVPQFSFSSGQHSPSGHSAKVRGGNRRLLPGRKGKSPQKKGQIPVISSAFLGGFSCTNCGFTRFRSWI